jgi:hypothetical protein
MGQLRRTATEIAEQQLEDLTAHAGLCQAASADSSASVADLLVMGGDRRPYLVRRLVTRAGVAGWLCWVSVSDAGWGLWRRQPVVRMAITLPPRPVLNGRAVGSGARAWYDVNKPRWPGNGHAGQSRPPRAW